MRSHEEFAAARAIKLIREELGERKLLADEENRRVANTLAELGFGAFVRFHASEGATAAKTEPPKPPARICRQPESTELSPIWRETSCWLGELHKNVRMSALGVAVFVLALTFFTVSDASVRTRWRRFKGYLFAVGVLTGVAALAVVLIWGPTTAWRWLLGGLVITPLIWLCLHYLVAYAERKGWIHPEKGEGSIHSEEVIFERAALRAPVLGHHLEHWFGVVTIVLIAVTVFASATVGWGYSYANTYADAAAEEARHAAAEMVIRTAQFSARQSELAREVAAAIERRFRLGLANQRAQLSKSDEFLKGRHDDEEERHSSALRNFKAQFSDIDEVIDLKDLNIDDDLRFPNRLLWQFPRVASLDAPPKDEKERAEYRKNEREKRNRNGYEAFALWDLESGDSVAWRNVASSLLARLMVFAIALYFLGQAMAMEPTRSGYVLLTAGVVFGSFGVVSSLVSAYPMIRLAGLAGAPPRAIEAILAEKDCPAVYSIFPDEQQRRREDEPRRRRELAAYYYSVGVVLEGSISDRSDLERAEGNLECANALKEDFVLARLKLASVRSMMRSLDLAEPYTSLPERSKVKSSTELAAAQDLHQQTDLELSATQRNSLAFDTALNALIARDEQGLTLSEKVAREALDLVKEGKMLARPSTEGMLTFNLGFVQLARGRFDEGRQAYKDGLLAESSDAFRLSALTDLETLWVLRCKGGKPPAGVTFDCPALDGAIVDIRKAVLAKKADVKQLALAPPLPKHDIDAKVTANHLSASVRGFDPAADDLWLVWSRKEPGWDSWRTLQRVSRPITAPRKDDDSIVVNSGTIKVRYSFLGSYWGAEGCLDKGTYRADLYANGTLVQTRDDIERKMPKMKAARFRELNVELCMPADWNVIPEKAAPSAQRGNYGVIRGVMNGAGMPAAFLFSFYVPTQIDGLTSCLVPGNDVRCAFNTLTAGKLITGDEPVIAFEKMTDSLDRRALVYRTWTSQDGGVHVIVARADSGSRDQLWDLLESAEVIYAENDITTTEQK